jgi:N utilization substance protein B
MSKSRSAARLAACQALYQHEMEGTSLPVLLHEFHQHRLGATIEDDLCSMQRSIFSTMS